MGTNNNHLCHLCNGELIPYGIGKLKCKFCDTIYEEEVINGEEGILLVDAYKQLRDGETDEAYKSFIDIRKGRGGDRSDPRTLGADGGEGKAVRYLHQF